MGLKRNNGKIAFVKEAYHFLEKGPGGGLRKPEIRRKGGFSSWQGY